MARHIVGPAADLPPGSCRLARIGRIEVSIFNVGGTYYALNNRCPHAGGPLCLGEVTGTTESAGPYRVAWVRQGEIVACPWHAWEFELASGRTITQPTKAVRTYPVRVEDGQVVLETGDPPAGRTAGPSGGG